jgi:serine/threonine protein kinase
MPSFKGASGRRWSYDADKRLGPAGGFGEVFLASDDRDEFAVKRIPLKVGDLRERRRREREVEIAQKLIADGTPSPHLLVPIDWGTLGEDLLLVMPRAEYSLAEIIPSPNFSRENRYRAIRDVALGLSELSSARVLHRDLKPGNVLWLQGTWRLSDFGISRDVDVSTATYTFNGAGSLPYMAPEVWEIRPATAKTDLYALGVLAYEVLSGNRPFHGPRPEDFERQHRQEIPPALQISDGRVGRLITRLLSKDPSSRPQDAQAVVEAIDLAMRRIDPAREGVAEAAAAMARVLSQREAEKSKRSQRPELAKHALSELGAFLQDFADDMSDVFPIAKYTEQEGCYWLHLDAAEIAIVPIENLYERNIGSAVAACSVNARLPGKLAESTRIYSPVPSIPRDMICPANLICDLVDKRFEWTVATFSIDPFLPNGQHNPNVVGVREESRSTYSIQHVREVPLNADGMMWLLRHIFECLSYKGDPRRWPSSRL